MTTPTELAARLAAAIEAGDVDAVRDLYAPEIVVWANFDDARRDRESALRVLSWLVSSTTRRHYEITRRVEIEGGVLQQHVLHGTTDSGNDFAMPACLVLRVDGEHITAIDEYLDPAPITKAMGAT
jgi:ketosteroid isomerase-like protein